MENNKQKWIKSAVEMFSYGQEDSLEDFVTHIDFFKRISGEIYREIQKTIEDEVTGTLVDKDELYRNLNRVLGIVDNENNALDFFLSGEYDYEGLESEKHRKMIEKVLEDPVARDRALVSYHPKMLAAFQSGDLDFIKEMNSLLHYDQRDEFLKDAYINAKRWILKLFQHIGQGQFVDNGITQQLSENDLDQFSYLNDFFKGEFAADDDIYKVVRGLAISYLSKGFTGTVDLLNEEMNGRLNDDYDAILMEASSAARAWAIRYLRDGHTEQFEDLVDIFGGVILNDPVIRQNMETNAGLWYAFYKVSVKGIN
jgi:hypothetical protein